MNEIKHESKIWVYSCYRTDCSCEVPGREKIGEDQSKTRIHSSRDSDTQHVAFHMKKRSRMKGGRPVREEALYQSFVLSRLSDLAEGRQMKDDGRGLAVSMIDTPGQHCIKYRWNSRNA